MQNRLKFLHIYKKTVIYQSITHQICKPVVGVY